MGVAEVSSLAGRSSSYRHVWMFAAVGSGEGVRCLTPGAPGSRILTPPRKRQPATHCGLPWIMLLRRGSAHDHNLREGTEHLIQVLDGRRDELVYVGQE